jgi:hypothetical protein
VPAIATWHCRVRRSIRISNAYSINLLDLDQLLSQFLIERYDAPALAFACFVGEVNMVAHFTISVTAYLKLNSKVERRSTLEPLAIFPAFVFLPTLVFFSSEGRWPALICTYATFLNG